MLKGNISSYRGSEERQFNESFPGLKSQTATLLHSQSQSALKNNNSINKNEKYSSLEEEDNDYHVPQFNVKITGDTIGESAEYTNET
jgi:flagellar motility protein MotE (MotC chaperone)